MVLASGIAVVRGLSLIVIGIMLVGSLFWMGIQMSDQPTPSLESAEHTGGPGEHSSQIVDDSDVVPVWKEWPKPQLALMISGEQHGYFEPCGCTSNQMGGMARRADLLNKLMDAGWDVRGVDLGGLSRRTTRQAQIKFEISMQALRDLQYMAVGLGPEDLRLQPDFLLSQDIPDETGNGLQFVSANLLFYNDPAIGTPAPFRIVEVGERRVGITSVLSETTISSIIAPGSNTDISWASPGPAIETALQEFDAQQVDFRILLSHSLPDESRQLAEIYPQFDVIVVAQGFSDPDPTVEPEKIGNTMMLQVGHKGKYVGVLGLYPAGEGTPVRFQLLPLERSEFNDAQQMIGHMREYQQRLRDEEIVVAEGVVGHPSGASFVGAETCRDCHHTSYDVWVNSPHAEALDSLDPANRREGYERLNGVSRMFDPECLSCHVTGWNAQEHIRYRTGFLNEEFAELANEDSSLHSRLAGNQCENCHGPASRHVELIEAGNIELAKKEVAVTLKQAKAICYRCHDNDNSPDFDFDTYWPQVEHYESE